MNRSFLVLLIIISACSANNKYFSDGKKWIPANFDPAKSVLLVEHYPGKEKWNAQMIDFLDKKYTGKYEVLDKAGILAINGRYSDTKVYKYAVLWGTLGGTSHTSFSGGGTTTNFSSPTVDYSGHFLDRAAGKEYPVTKKYNNYGSQGYIPFFNSVIKYSK
jgi:hypothetical protein